MPNSTLFYYVNKFEGRNRLSEVTKLFVETLSENTEPAENCIQNILAFSKAYRTDKSEIVGQVDYVMN